MDRQEEIRSKGFDFGKIKVGPKALENAAISLNSIAQATNRNLTNKQYILKSLGDRDIDALRAISNHFYRTNGIYNRVCNYAAALYRYDWLIEPEVYDQKMTPEKVVAEFNKALTYLDNSNIKKVSGDITLNAIINGAYYGYFVETATQLILQELPIKYCRSRYTIAGRPAVEFNMKFFDDKFSDTAYRLKVLKLFPKEFQEGYVKYKKGTLENDNENKSSWYLLDPDFAFKISGNINDTPAFVNAIPSIIDLDLAQDLDRRKQLQKLLKIIVQKLPMDKNGDLIFDVDEAKDIHHNAVEMLANAIGVDVLTTFADVDSIDTSDKNSSTTVDDLKKVERTVYNSFGISQNLFNADGNLALNNSILNDEGNFRGILLQLQMLFDRMAQRRCKSPKKMIVRLYMLETTQYNYRELSKMYKEQTQIGFSKMLPQIALGHSQSFILNTAVFENQILKLSEIMIPPLMSSTLSGEDILKPKNKQTGEEKENGRPPKDDDQKSEKTIQNQESMS